MVNPVPAKFSNLELAYILIRNFAVFSRFEIKDGYGFEDGFYLTCRNIKDLISNNIIGI